MKEANIKLSNGKKNLNETAKNMVAGGGMPQMPQAEKCHK
jgi:hypothetical protein